MAFQQKTTGTFVVHPTKNDVSSISGDGKYLRESIVTDYWNAITSGGSWVASGFDYFSDTGLSVTLNQGTAVLEGYWVRIQNAHSVTLYDDATNSVYLTFALDGDDDVDGWGFEVNTTATAPTTPYVYLGTFTTASGAVTGQTDERVLQPTGWLRDTDIPAGPGFVTKNGADSFVTLKSKLDATTAPTATDDSAAGYAVGSMWIDVTLGTAYVCVDATATSAQWDGIRDHIHTSDDVSDFNSALDSRITSTWRGQINGLASLDSGGKIPTAQLPSTAINDTFVVADQPTMLALTAQTGDVAVRTDVNKTFILQGSDPTVLGNWQEMYTAGLVNAVNGYTGTVVLDTGDLAENGNLWYTDARVDARLDTVQSISASWTFSSTIDFDNAAQFKHSGVRLQQEGSDPTGAAGYTSVYALAGDALKFRDGTGTIYQAASRAWVDAHVWDTSDITTGTFADARIAQSNVTQHQAAITTVGTLGSLTVTGNITSSSGQLGVGASPDRPLYVTGATETVARFENTGTTSSSIRLDASGSAGQVLVSNSAGLLGLWTGATERWRVGTSGDLLPKISLTYDLGDPTYRVAQIYAEDLDLTDDLTVGDSATITGDLTVDTSLLYASASTDKVIVGSTVTTNAKTFTVDLGGLGDAVVATIDGVLVRNAGAAALIVRNDTDNVEAVLYSSTTFAAAGTTTNHPFNLRTNNADRLGITNGGDINVISGSLQMNGAAVINTSGDWIGNTIPVVKIDANLADQTANELITGAWTYQNSITLDKTNTATSGAQYNSQDLILKASSWDTTANAGSGGEDSPTFTLRNVGTSAAGVEYRLALLNNASTEVWAVDQAGAVTTGALAASGTIGLSGASPIITITDTDTTASTLLNGASSVGGFVIDVDSVSAGSGPFFAVSVGGTERYRVTESGNHTLTGAVTTGALTATGLTLNGSGTVTGNFYVDGNGLFGRSGTPASIFEVDLLGSISQNMNVTMVSTATSADYTSGLQVGEGRSTGDMNVAIWVDGTGNIGYIQAATRSSAYQPLHLNPGGAQVTVGAGGLATTGAVSTGTLTATGAVTVDAASNANLIADAGTTSNISSLYFYAAGSSYGAVRFYHNASSVLRKIGFEVGGAERFSILGDGAATFTGAVSTGALTVTGQVTAVKDDANGGQVFVKGATDANKQAWFGFDTTNDRGVLYAIHQGVAAKDLWFNNGVIKLGATGALTTGGDVDVTGIITSTGLINSDNSFRIADTTVITIDRDLVNIVDITATGVSVFGSATAVNTITTQAADGQYSLLAKNAAGSVTGGLYSTGSVLYAAVGHVATSTITTTGKGIVGGALQVTGSYDASVGSLGVTGGSGLYITGVTGTTYDVALATSGGTIGLGVVTSTGAVVMPNAVSTGALTAPQVTINDNGAGSPLLSVRADDAAPWAVIVGNDTYWNSASNGLKIQQTNAGNAVIQVNGNAEYRDLQFQFMDNTTLVYHTMDETGLSMASGTSITTTGTVSTGALTVSAVQNTPLMIAHAADAVSGSKAGLDFRMKGAGGGPYVAGAVHAEAEGTWSTTSGTRNASLVLSPVASGGTVPALTLASDLSATFAGNTVSVEPAVGNAEVRLWGATTSNEGVLSFGDSSERSAIHGGYGVGGGGDLSFYTDTTGGTPVLRAYIGNDGAVDFQGGAVSAGTLTSGHIYMSATSKFYLDGGANTYIKGEDPIDTIQFITAGSVAMKIDASQNVGFGTATPSERIHILRTSGDAGLTVETSFATGNAKINIKSLTTRTGELNFSDGTNSGRILYGHAADEMQFYQAGSLALTISATQAITTTGTFRAGSWMAIDATERLYFDINTGSHTYMTEGGNDSLDTWVGGVKVTNASPGLFSVPSGSIKAGVHHGSGMYGLLGYREIEGSTGLGGYGMQFDTGIESPVIFGYDSPGYTNLMRFSSVEAADRNLSTGRTDRMTINMETGQVRHLSASPTLLDGGYTVPQSVKGYYDNSGHYIWRNGSGVLEMVSANTSKISTAGHTVDATLTVTGATTLNSTLATYGNHTHFANTVAVFNSVDNAGYGYIANGTTSTSSLVFYFGGAENLIMNYQGRVGIGTSTPGTNLEVIGGTANTGSYADGVVQIAGGNSPLAFVGQSNLNPAFNRWGFKLRETADGDFSIHDYRYGLTRLLIDSSGNVGLGTTNPGTMLHLSSPTGAAIIRLDRNDTIIETGDSYGQIQWQSQDANIPDSTVASIEAKGIGAGTSGQTALYFRTSDIGSLNQDRMVINHFGYVGINDTTPSYQLDVNGTFRVTSTALISGVTTIANELNITGNVITDGDYYIQNNQADEDLVAIKSTNYGYSAGYHVVQLGVAGATKSISIGYDPSTNLSGSFTGNEILFPNSISVIAPNAADNGYKGIFRLDSGDDLQIGGAYTLTAGVLTIDSDNISNRLTLNAAGVTTTGTAQVNGHLDVNHSTTAANFHSGAATDVAVFTNTSGSSLTVGASAGMISLDASLGEDVRLRFNGTEYFRVTSAGNWLMQSQKRLYFDGGSDTYIYESGGDTVQIINGGGLGTHTFDAGFTTSGSVTAGVAKMAEWATVANYAYFGHKDVAQSSGFSLIHSSVGKTTLNSAAGQQIAFTIGASDKMALDASGNLLVGTTSTSSGAHVYAKKTYSSATGDNIAAWFYYDQDTATTGTISGLRGEVRAVHATGTVANATAVTAYAQTYSGAGTTTNLTAQWIRTVVGTGTTATNAYSLKIDDKGRTGTIGTGYAIYSADTDPSYFAGKVGISRVPTTRELEISGDAWFVGANRSIYLDSSGAGTQAVAVGSSGTTLIIGQTANWAATTIYGGTGNTVTVDDTLTVTGTLTLSDDVIINANSSTAFEGGLQLSNSAATAGGGAGSITIGYPGMYDGSMIFEMNGVVAGYINEAADWAMARPFVALSTLSVTGMATFNGGATVPYGDHLKVQGTGTYSDNYFEGGTSNLGLKRQGGTSIMNWDFSTLKTTLGGEMASTMAHVGNGSATPSVSSPFYVTRNSGANATTGELYAIISHRGGAHTHADTTLRSHSSAGMAIENGAATGSVWVTQDGTVAVTGNTVFGATSTVNEAQLYATRSYTGAATRHVRFYSYTNNAASYHEGLTVRADVTHTTGTKANSYGTSLEAYATGAGGTTTTYKNLTLSGGSLNATANVTSYYQFYINGITTTGSVTNKYALYQSGSGDQNYFAGHTLFGDTTSTPHSNTAATGAVILNNGQLGIGVSSIGAMDIARHTTAGTIAYWRYDGTVEATFQIDTDVFKIDTVSGTVLDLFANGGGIRINNGNALIGTTSVHSHNPKLYVTRSNADTSGIDVGMFVNSSQTAAHTGTVYGLATDLRPDHTSGTIATAVAINGYVYTGFNTATTTTAIGLQAMVDANTSHTITTAIGLRIKEFGGAGTFGTKWAIKSDADAPSYFNGRYIQLGNNSAGDQYVYFRGGNDWSLGMDNSDSDAFVISNYSTLGTNNAVKIATGSIAEALKITSSTTELNATGAIRLRENGSIILEVDDGDVKVMNNGNLAVGGYNAISGQGVIALYNNTVPTASITNGVVLYSEDVSASAELKVRDEAGNITVLSPHNFSLIPDGPSETSAWAYYSENEEEIINVDMLKLARIVEAMSGEQLVHIQKKLAE